MKPWQPYKLTFCPIDYYEDDSFTLNDSGKRFQLACSFIDTALLNIINSTGLIC